MKHSNVFDYIFLLRPSIMIALWTFYFAGVFIAYRVNGDAIMFNMSNIPRILSLLLLYSFLMGAVYVINQIVDVDTDRINNKLHILPHGIISLANAKIYAAALTLISLIGIWAAAEFSITVKILFMMSFVLGYMYSVPPFKLKRRPFADLFDNVIGYGLIAVIIGFESTGNSFQLHYLKFTLPYLFSMGAVFINTTLMDYEGDKAVNALTTGVFLGFRNAAILSLILMMMSLASAVIIKDIPIIIAAGISLPLYLFALIKNNIKAVKISVQLSAPILSLILSIIFPYFLLMNILTLTAMRVYYKQRFNIRYTI